METITIASSRGSAFAETEMVFLSALIVGAVVVWTVIAGLKHLRSRHNIRRV